MDDLLWKLKFDKPRPNLPYTNEEKVITDAKQALLAEILKAMPYRYEDGIQKINKSDLDNYLVELFKK